MTHPANWLMKLTKAVTRLSRDSRGNVLALSAVMIAVTAVLAGSSVDTARLYLVRGRLQQACDAGVLAGRKFALDTSTTLDSNASQQATNFFNSNFKTGWLGTNSVSFTPSKTADNRVAATASTVVPMTLTKIVSAPDQTITVTCEARYDIADTDIMFVLDTTGSMSCAPGDDDSACNSYLSSVTPTAYTRPADSALGASTGSANDSVAGYPGSYGYYVPEKSGSRISALRNAVVQFYNTLDTNKQPNTNIRYGFVTYTSTVNAGKAIMSINPQYMVGGAGNSTSTWTYQSRRVIADYLVSQTTTGVFNNLTSEECDSYKIRRNPSTPLTYNSRTRQATEQVVAWTASGNGNGNGSLGTCSVLFNVYGPQWEYGPTSLDVRNFLTNASVPDPTRIDGGTAKWQGCVEERNTTASTSFNAASLPGDLDPDLVPTSDATRWRPMWAEVIYGRNYYGGPYGFTSTGTTTSNGDTTNVGIALSYFNYNSNALLRAGWVSCGKPVRRVSTMSLTDVTNYVNASDFRPMGGTYHDTGMIWGVRMISPNGIFANDTAAWPTHDPPNRVIVYLTDGIIAPNTSIYGMYGVEYFDRRVTGGSFTNQTNNHNARFLAECARAKSMNISIWTVTIGSSIAPSLLQCATNTAQALNTTSGSDLAAKFQEIALKVAQLRVSK